jgi:hypothetical protein
MEKSDMIARILDAALMLCSQQASATVDEVAIATKFDRADVVDGLASSARSGALIARPGGVYVRALSRRLRLPGESFVTDLRLSVADLMVARA